MSKVKSAELEAAMKNLREQKKKLQEEKQREKDERKRIREEKRLQKVEAQLKKMDQSDRVDKQKERVILGVQARPCLWDKTCSEYKDKHAKDIGWKEVGKDLGLNAEKVKSTWNNLTDQAREIWRNEVYHSGAGTDDKIEESKTWKFYKSMEFYRKVYKFRKTESNFKVNGSVNLSDSEDEMADDVEPETFDHLDFTFNSDSMGDEGNDESQGSSLNSINTDQTNATVQNTQSSPYGVISFQEQNSQASTSQASTSGVSNYQKTKVQNKPSQKSAIKPSSKENKRKHDEIEEKLLSHMELAAKVFTETEDPTDKFLSYLGENLRLVPTPKRRKCEQDILKVVNGYNEEDHQVKVDVISSSES